MPHLKSILLILALLWQQAAMAQTAWYEAFSPQTSLVLSLRIDDGHPTLYSPLQSSAPIAATSYSWHADTLRFECASIGFKATLHRDADGFSGTWRQGLLREQAHFAPADTLFRLRRPQTPQPPFPYTEREVSTDYVDAYGDSVHLAATLTIPSSATAPSGGYPCLLLISGSGQQNRDEEIFQHRPFAVLADHLARRGIATLRYDDRGMGQSRGSLDSATTTLFANDAEQLFLTMQQQPDLDTLRLGLLGHSEGALISLIIASHRADVSFVIMLAGQGCSGRRVLLQQNRALFLQSGLDPQMVNIRLQCMEELFDLPTTATVKDFQQVLLRHTAALTPAQQDSLQLSKKQAYALRQQLLTPWMQHFLLLNPKTYLPRVQCPILAIAGDKDLQVPPDENLSAISRLTAGRAEVHLLPGLNHLLQPCTTGLPSEYLFIDQTLAPEVLQLVADFALRAPASQKSHR